MLSIFLPQNFGSFRGLGELFDWGILGVLRWKLLTWRDISYEDRGYREGHSTQLHLCQRSSHLEVLEASLRRSHRPYDQAQRDAMGGMGLNHILYAKGPDLTL